MNGKYDIMKLNQGKLFLIGERYKSSDAMDHANFVVSEHTWGGGINALYFLKRIHLLGFYMVQKSCESHRLYTIDWIGS